MDIKDDINLKGSIVPHGLTDAETTALSKLSVSDGTLIWNKEDKFWMFYDGTNFVPVHKQDRFLLNQLFITGDSTRYIYDNTATHGLSLPLTDPNKDALGVKQGSWVEVMNTRTDGKNVVISGHVIKADGTGGNLEVKPGGLIKLVYRGRYWYESTPSSQGTLVSLSDLRTLDPIYYQFSDFQIHDELGNQEHYLLPITQAEGETNFNGTIINDTNRFVVPETGDYDVEVNVRLYGNGNNIPTTARLRVLKEMANSIAEDIVESYVTDITTAIINKTFTFSKGELIRFRVENLLSSPMAIQGFSVKIKQSLGNRVYAINNNTNNITLADGQTLADVTEPLRARFYGSTANIASTDSTGLEGGELAFVRDTKELYVFDREVRSYGDVSPIEGGGTYKKVTDKSLVSTDQFEYASNSNGEYEWNKVTGVIKMWGTIAGSQNADGTQTLPTSFDNTDYSVTATIKNPVSTTAIYSVNVSDFTTNAFNFTRRLLEADETTIGGASSEQVCWQAIGRKVST